MSSDAHPQHPDGGIPDGGVPDGGIPDGGSPDGPRDDGGSPDGPRDDGGSPAGPRDDQPAAHGRAVLAALVDHLRAADRAIADAIALLMHALDRSVAERLDGLPVEQLLGLDAARTRADRRMLLRAATVLADLPATWTWFRDGVLSWSQVRATVLAAERLDRAQRAWLDQTIAGTDRVRVADDPDRFVDDVAALADLARAEQTERDHQRAHDRRFFAVQPALDGATAAFYGEGDATTLAVIIDAIDHAAISTHHGPEPDEHDATDGGDGDGDGEEAAADSRRTRAQRRFDGLAHLAATWLAGGPTAPRPARPLLHVITDRAQLTGSPDQTGEAGAERDDTPATLPAQLAWRGPGPVHLTQAALDQLVCDATLRTILVGGTRLLGVSAPVETVSDELRAALVARDGRCRFPTCRVQATACHAHHLLHRRRGGPTTLDNLVLLCDHHHRLVHRRGWQLTLHPDDTLTLTYAHRTLRSQPRMAGPTPSRPPPPPAHRGRGRRHTTARDEPPPRTCTPARDDLPF